MNDRRDGKERRVSWRDAFATKRLLAIVFVLVGIYNTGLWYKGEYDSCVRNKSIRSTYNKSFDTQREFLEAARDARRSAANDPQAAPEQIRSNTEAANTYQELINGQKSVRELDCGLPFPDNG